MFKVFCAGGGDDPEALSTALNCGYWSCRNISKSPSKVFLKDGPGSIITVNTNEQGGHQLIWGIIISVTDEIIPASDSPWGTKVRGRYVVDWQVTSPESLFDYRLEVKNFAGMRSGHPARSHKNGNIISDALLQNKEQSFLPVEKSINNISNLIEIFDYDPTDIKGVISDTGLNFLSKFARQCGASEVGVYEAFYDLFIDPNPVKVVIIFCGKVKGHRLQWLFEILKHKARLPEDVRESLEVFMIEDFNVKNWWDEKKPLILLTDYKDKSRVTDIRSKLNWGDELLCTVIADEIQLSYALNSECPSPKKHKGGFIHKEFDELIRRNGYDKLRIKRSIFISATNLSSGFKELNYGGADISYAFKDIKRIEDGGTYVHISDMNPEFRSDDYFAQLCDNNLTQQHIDDFCSIPISLARNNIFIITPGSLFIDPQRDLAKSIMRIRNDAGLLGSYYGVFNGTDGFLIYNVNGSVFYQKKNKSFKECISLLDKEIHETAPIFIVSDILLSCNTQISNVEKTRTIGGQWINFSESRADNIGVDNGTHFLRAEGYHKDKEGNVFLPRLFTTQSFYDMVVIHDDTNRSWFLDKIENPNKHISEMSFPLPNLVRKEQHLDYKSETIKSSVRSEEKDIITSLVVLHSGNPCIEADENNKIYHHEIPEYTLELLTQYCSESFTQKLKSLGEQRNTFKTDSGQSLSHYFTTKIRKICKQSLNYLPASVRFIEGDERTKKSGGGNDVSVYVNADFARIKEKKDNGENVKDQDRDAIYWAYKNCILLRVRIDKKYFGNTHSFTGTLQDVTNKSDIITETFYVKENNPAYA